MPEMEAIQSATQAAAILLGKREDLGTIAPGMRADVVAVAGNPLTDITQMLNMQFVMKDGRVYKQ